jgi:hypothetical protein
LQLLLQSASDSIKKPPDYYRKKGKKERDREEAIKW